MSQLDQVKVTLSIEQAETLYQTGATSFQGQSLGVMSCLPSTNRAQPNGFKFWNPGRDPWLLDQTRDGDQLRCLLWIDRTLEYFAGHFPGQPILPGVVHLDWSIALAALHWPNTAPQNNFSGVQNLKFKQPIEPVALLQLVLTQQPGKIDFVFSSPTEVRSQGTLFYRV